MKILFAGGGSIGHIAPCVAVWRSLQTIVPSAESLTICSDRPAEQAFLSKESMPSIAIPLPRRSLSLPFTFWKDYRIARAAMESFRPDVIFCKGGAVSVPVTLTARAAKIPIVIHESDAIAGRATRITAPFAQIVCTGFPHTAGLRGIRVLNTGNPVRPQIVQGRREEGLRITGLSGERPILLVCGGSQGSQALNTCVLSHLRNLLSLCDVIHLTGEGKAGAAPQDGYWPSPFVQEELSHLYAASDLALSRGGAVTLSDLAANGIPTIVVALRGLAQDHQELNALEAAKSGGCIAVEQEELSAQFLPLVHRLLQERAELQRMSTRFRTFSHPDAAQKIAHILLQTATGAVLDEVVAP